MNAETKKHRIVRELREMADYIESRSFDENSMFAPFSLYIFPLNATDFGAAVAAAGALEKSANALNLVATVSFGQSKFKIAIASNLVCKKVKIGEKVVEAVPEHTVDIFETNCPESFIALKDKQPTDAETEALVSSETDF